MDASSDLYSLGAVAYELLTGQPVFSGSTVGEVMVRQVQELPEKPSVRLKRPVSPDFEDLLVQCLAKRPSDRPASAAALEEALTRCTASGAWTRQDAADWWLKLLSRAERENRRPADHLIASYFCEAWRACSMSLLISSIFSSPMDRRI